MASAGAGGAGASRIELLDRVRACLWGMHIGDALAMPVHWYYDTGQLRRDFGAIKGYVAPKEKIPGSIMSLSNTGGGGRGDDAGTVVGEIILQGKRKYWSRGGNFHYHRGMAAGENTLEVTISRQCYMASLTDHHGRFAREDVRERYISLLTTPGSHNDTYAGTCHRMFFANRANGKALDECPDNDQHNVDTIDGLVNLPPVICAGLARAGGNASAAKLDAAAAAVLLRRSESLPQYASLYANILSLLLSGDADLRGVIEGAARAASTDLASMARRGDPMTA